MSHVKCLSRKIAMLLASVAVAGVPAAAQEAPAVSQSVPSGAPRLVVAIAIDQFSADIFAQYRQRFTGGLRG